MDKILIIDDDVQLTELLIEFLSSYKYKLVAKHSPEEGLEYLEKKRSECNHIRYNVTRNGWLSGIKKNQGKLINSCDYAYCTRRGYGSYCWLRIRCR